MFAATVRRERDIYRNVCFKCCSSQSNIEIHWEEPVKSHGEITGYKILYGPFVQGQSWHSFENITVKAGVNRYRISNLRKNFIFLYFKFNAVGGK